MSAQQSYNEHTVLLNVSKGDEDAFCLLYKKWQPQLSSFIFKITASKELTAELVQDIFLKIWMSRETLSEIENFKSYLYVISRNQAINVFKKTTKEFKRFTELADIHPSEVQSEEDRTEFERLCLVDEAIDTLSPRQKEVYLLHRHQRLTYKEIAKKLGIGTESVKTHINLAVKSITAFLKGRMALLLLLIEIFSENS